MAAIAACCARLRHLSLLTVALLAACGGTDGGREAQSPFDFYVLALSWSPSYCLAEGASANPQQCGRDAPDGFVVHGLWPQFEEGWPEFCDPDPAQPSRGDIARIDDLIPSSGLIRHQWRKHGTCSGLSARDYFDRTRDAFERIDIPPLPAGGRMDGVRIAQAFQAANPDMPPDGLAVTCRGGLVREVRICLTRDLDFRGCEEVAARSCRQRDLSLPATAGD